MNCEHCGEELFSAYPCICQHIRPGGMVPGPTIGPGLRVGPESQVHAQRPGLRNCGVCGRLTAAPSGVCSLCRHRSLDRSTRWERDPLTTDPPVRSAPTPAGSVSSPAPMLEDQKTASPIGPPDPPHASPIGPPLDSGCPSAWIGDPLDFDTWDPAIRARFIGTGSPESGGSENILHEAIRITSGPRAAEYGTPTDNWTRTAEIASAILGVPLSPVQCCQVALAMKLARLRQTPGHRDSLVDLAGYAWVWSELVSKD